VQSGVGAHVIATAPEEARKALVAIEKTSREALQETRRLLGVLRDGDTGDRAGERSPAPGLSQLDDLLGEVREAGLDADVDLFGAGAALPPLADLTAYRVVQEALTNGRKHARAAAARVTIRGDGDSVVVEVVDDGVGPPGRRSRGEDAGQGLLGMRERVAACGGVLEAGPGAGGGFRVMARLPLRSDR
jgi:signal transduction histidine kinase